MIKARRGASIPIAFAAAIACAGCQSTGPASGLAHRVELRRLMKTGEFRRLIGLDAPKADTAQAASSGKDWRVKLTSWMPGKGAEQKIAAARPAEPAGGWPWYHWRRWSGG